MSKRVRKSEEPAPVNRGWFLWLPPLLAAAIYGVTLFNEFVFDDRVVVLRDARLGDLSRFFDVSLNELVARYWSLMLDSALWGLNPLGFHLTNVLLHAAVALVLFLYLRRLTRAFTGHEAGLAVLAGTLVFVAHPMDTEAVAAVSHRKEMLAALFLLLALYRAEASPRSWVRSLEVAAYLLLALLSKAPAIVFFPLLWSVDILRQRRDLRFYVIPGLAAAAYVASRFSALSHGMAQSDYYRAFNPQMVEATGLERILTSFKTLGFYWWLGVWPWSPTMERFVPASTLTDWEPYAVILLAAAGLYAAWRWRRSRPLLGIGLVWLIVTPLPTINLIPLNFLFSERYMYVPLLGLAPVVTWAVLSLKGRWPAVAALVLAVAVFSPLVVKRSLEWKTTSTLLYATVRDNPGSPRLNRFYSMDLSRQGRYEEALAAAKIAVEGMPKSPTNWYVYAQALSANGKTQEASDAYRRAVDVSKRPPAMWISNYGVSLAMLGRLSEAQQAFATALERAPDDPRVRLHYAQGLLMSPQTQLQAVDYMVDTLARDPSDQSLWALLAETRLAQRDLRAAQEAARRGIQSGADPALILYLEALELEAQGARDEARRKYEQVMGSPQIDGQLRARVARALRRVR